MIRTLSGPAPQTVLPHGTIDSHMHMYLPGYEAQPGGPPLPLGALPDADQYRRFMRWIGIDRVVITQGNAHQSDNANLLACLAEMGEVARGVAVIHPDTEEAEIARLDAAGVVGARIMDLAGGAVGLAALEGVDARAHDAGWVTIVQFDGSQISAQEDRLAALRSRWVLDHHGKFLSGVGRAEVEAMKRLIDRGNCWIKFAGAYEWSRSGPPDYADVAAIAREIAAHAPDRIVWGSNWPHNQARTTADYPDDRALTDTVLSWLPSDDARHQALVTTPEALFGFPPL
ncbi:amidohydrolase family protein [Falsirhodobacter algicola]|uniref:Amidohydrolase family protein n=2 Tax=Falsirhodobacter algicola TaxID=2692330 RepID=A0A8J8MUR7_9RHOB|nr:amidohydrolase family protein [Falsirhodobacter algicola]